MKNKRTAIFLDRDGTINVDYGYVYQKNQLQFIEGVIEGLKMLQDAGYLLIIVTNQSGIARGYYTLNEMNDFHEYMVRQLNESGINISKIYYCPHLEGCDCRKPKLELFYRAQREFDIDFESSYAIGDKIRDLALCDKENVKGFLLTEDMEEKQNSSSKISKCKNLLEAAKIIVNSRGENDL